MRHLLGVIATALICTLAAAPAAEAHGLRSSYVVEGETGIPGIPLRVPEGVAFDPLGGDFYATAIFGGRITRIDGRTGVETTVYQEVDNPVMSFAGVKVAPLRRILWVCAVDLATDPTTPAGTVYAIDLRPRHTGEVIRRFAMPGPFFCNDIALDYAGDAYVTNSIGPTIYKIDASAIDDPTAGAVPFATSLDFLPDFSIPGSIGLNGAEITPDGRRLLVVRSIPAAMFSIDLQDPTDIRPVSFTGDGFSQNPDPAGDPLAFLGPDGLVFIGLKLYVSYHGGVQQLSFRDCDFTRARVKSTTEVPTGLSTAAGAWGDLYVIDSEIVPVTQPQFGLTPMLPNTITRVDLRLFR